MPIQAQLPDGSMLEFPDGTDPGIIDATVKKHLGVQPGPQYEPGSPGAMFGQRQPTRGQKIFDESLLKGAASLPGIFGNLQNIRDMGVDWLTRKGIGAIEGREMPSTLAIPQQDQFATSETFHAPLRERGYIDSPELKPQNKKEEYIASTAEGAGAMLPFGPFGAVLGATSGAGGQAGEDLTGSKWGRLGGALLAPVPLIAGKAALTSTPGKVVAGATEGMTGQQWEDAARIFRNAQEAGTPITAAEALAQATGGNRMQSVQRVVEQSARGGPVMQDFMAQRPEANRAAMRSVMDETLGPAPAEPAGIAPRIQRSADAAIERERGITNQISAPAYAETSNSPATQLSSRGFAAIADDPVVTGAIQAVKSNPGKYGNLSGLPDNSVKVLDAAKKYLDDAVAAAQDSKERFAASNYGGATKKITDAIDAEFPRYASARNIQAMRQRYVEEPLRQSPVGDLAGMGGANAEERFGSVANVLFPRDPKTLTPDAVTRTFNHLKVTDPDAARELTRQFITSEFERTTRGLSAGANQWGAAKFKATIAGGDTQAANLEAAVKSLPNGDAAWRGFNNLLEVFEAQGKRHVPGSLTEPNRLLTQELSGSGALTGITKPTRFVGEWWERFRYGQNTEELARLLTDPDAVRKLQNLALFKPASDKAASMAAEILGAQRETGKLLPAGAPQ
jgi:hypothetical protein